MSHPDWVSELDAICRHFRCVSPTMDAALSSIDAAEALSESLSSVESADKGLVARCAHRVCPGSNCACAA